MSMQTLGGLDHELWSNEHLPGIYPASPYSTMNHADALPPTSHTSTVGSDDPPHLTIVSVYLPAFIPLADDGFVEGPWTT